MRKLITGVVLFWSIAGTSQAEVATDDYVTYRQSVFNLMGWHFKQMGAMVQGRTDYDAAEFKQRAEAVAALAQMPAEGFIPETRGTQFPHHVKPEVWYQTERFNELMQGLVVSTTELAKQAGAEDKDDLRAAFGKVARQCKSCHDRYRERM
jgi:cytochrome c556